MKTLMLLMLCLLASFNLRAEDKIFLYGDFYAGMTNEELLKTGPAQCDSYPYGTMICNRQRIVFAAMEWTQFFEFKNNRLTCVAFGQPISLTAISAAMAWLQEENYTPINAETGKESISFFPLYDDNRKNVFEKEYGNFSRNLPSSDRFMSYLVKNSILKEFKAMDKMPCDTIMVTLGGSKSQGNIFICFEEAKNVTIKP